MTTGERLAAELRRAWNGEPWHGPSAATVLSRLTAQQAAHRRARGSHTPWELVLHLTLWAEVPLRRFDEPSYAPRDEEDFRRPIATTDAQWQHDVAALGDAVERLAQCVTAMPDAALNAPVSDRGYTYVTMIDGVAQHLAYHSGQAAVLARSEEVAGVIAPPALIAVAAMAAAEALRVVYAWPLGMSRWTGVPVVLAALGLLWWAHEQFVKARTPAAPWRASRFLVLGGPYSVTRNPMYIAGLVFLAGVGMLRANAWYLVVLVPTWCVLHWGVVLREERYLLKLFGAPYQELLDTTRRWLV
ncbi:MAG: methyltransferase [Gemmatimonadaceae bacterium]|jgi:protein-S-isoprenylcysteine O-methyltransferase Ste14